MVTPIGVPDASTLPSTVANAVHVLAAVLLFCAPDVLRHRIGLTYEAEAEEITTDKIVAQVLAQTPVPAQ